MEHMEKHKTMMKDSMQMMKDGLKMMSEAMNMMDGKEMENNSGEQYKSKLSQRMSKMKMK